MALYNFTLTLSGVTADTENLEDALFESGCDDALLCFYGKSVYLEFDREAPSLDYAIRTAVEDAESAGVNARVESVDSAVVGLSDIAELTGMSRQAIALLKNGARGPGTFPGPVQRLRGQSPLWDWAVVAAWLTAQGRLDTYSELAENAKVISKWNVALRAGAAEDPAEIEAITRSLITRREKCRC
ncbi:helix-turn-helix transcriptional regulator [Morganella morganii]|uniref:helix-turn-helix transcriptional regulator n=1 Tax=Morganella morganii TaxID=582 RepID=UPI001E50453B|nr:DNA-binding protein [Morganella morganii]UFH70210.1 DNA-binding protein [Morganella morganii]